MSFIIFVMFATINKVNEKKTRAAGTQTGVVRNSHLQKRYCTTTEYQIELLVPIMVVIGTSNSMDGVSALWHSGIDSRLGRNRL